jgi:hypothetical protein
MLKRACPLLLLLLLPCTLSDQNCGLQLITASERLISGDRYRCTGAAAVAVLRSVNRYVAVCLLLCSAEHKPHSIKAPSLVSTAPTVPTELTRLACRGQHLHVESIGGTCMLVC